MFFAQDLVFQIEVVKVFGHDMLRSLTLTVISVSAFDMLYKGVLYMYIRSLTFQFCTSFSRPILLTVEALLS